MPSLGFFCVPIGMIGAFYAVPSPIFKDIYPQQQLIQSLIMRRNVVMGEPAEHDKPDKPEDHPGQGHGTDPDWVPPGHGGTPPGQEDKPETPEEPEEGEPHPEHPIAAPGEEPHPEPHAAVTAPVEALLGLRDFLAVAPRRRSASVTKAAHVALQRWIQLQGHDVHGFYTMAEWQGFYADTMSYTG